MKFVAFPPKTMTEALSQLSPSFDSSVKTAKKVDEHEQLPNIVVI